MCRDGLEAYEKLKVNRYDGVILDVNMPRMGGLELLERLQKERIKTKCDHGQYHDNTGCGCDDPCDGAWSS